MLVFSESCKGADNGDFLDFKIRYDADADNMLPYSNSECYLLQECPSQAVGYRFCSLLSHAGAAAVTAQLTHCWMSSPTEELRN